LEKTCTTRGTDVLFLEHTNLAITLAIFLFVRRIWLLITLPSLMK